MPPDTELPRISGRLHATLAEVELPALKGRGTGWGSSLWVRPTRPQVFWTRNFGLTPNPWSRYDLETGEIATARGRAGLHGELRDAVADRDGRHAWFLLTGGLARVDLDEMREVGVLRARFPPHLWRLFEIGPDLLGASGWTTQTVVIVDKHRLEIIRTVRMPSPDLAIAAGPTSVDLLAFNAMTERTLDMTTLKLGPIAALPLGQGAVTDGSRAWLVAGNREKVADAPSIRRVKGERVIAYDLSSRRIMRESPSLPKPVGMIGVDGDGRPVVGIERGLAVLEPSSLAPDLIAETEVQRGFGAVALLPDRRSVAILPNRFGRPERLLVLRWESAASGDREREGGP